MSAFFISIFYKTYIHHVKNEKSPAKAGLLEQNLIVRLRILNVGSLLAFRALRDFELNFLTFFEGLEAVHLDCGEVSE